jgi:hypothetical protein
MKASSRSRTAIPASRKGDSVIIVSTKHSIVDLNDIFEEEGVKGGTAARRRQAPLSHAQREGGILIHELQACPENHGQNASGGMRFHAASRFGGAALQEDIRPCSTPS